jgi:hypothetical protein
MGEIGCFSRRGAQAAVIQPLRSGLITKNPATPVKTVCDRESPRRLK